MNDTPYKRPFKSRIKPAYNQRVLDTSGRIASTVLALMLLLPLLGWVQEHGWLKALALACVAGITVLMLSHPLRALWALLVIRIGMR